MTEIWKDIPGYEGKYQASSQGRIRSLPHEVNGICHFTGKQFTRISPGKVLKPAGQKRGPHLRVVLEHGGNGQLVHTLVARAFLGERPSGMDIRHLDGNPLNNAVENLCYGSRTENIFDAYRCGKAWRTTTPEQIQQILDLLAQDVRPHREIARRVGVSEQVVSCIYTGRYKYARSLL